MVFTHDEYILEILIDRLIIIKIRNNLISSYDLKSIVLEFRFDSNLSSENYN